LIDTNNSKEKFIINNMNSIFDQADIYLAIIALAPNDIINITKYDDSIIRLKEISGDTGNPEGKPSYYKILGTDVDNGQKVSINVEEIKKYS